MITARHTASCRAILLLLSLSGAMVLLTVACKKEPVLPPGTTPYAFPNLPAHFRAIPLDPDNIPTVEGVALGRRLFHDNILSKNLTKSCASCHMPELSFSDPNKFSTGVDGIAGRRNSMTLVNLAWSPGRLFFWDGRALGLPAQALLPVEDPIELHLPWPEAVSRLEAHDEYPDLFYKAFGVRKISPTLVTKAIAQFETTLLSFDSPFDRYMSGDSSALSASAKRGMQLFLTESADCFHCHITNELFVHPNRAFGNNGLDEFDFPNEFPDQGRGEVTGRDIDKGKFKIPTLRNLAFTAPYMHDGRFATLEEVIDFYNEGPKLSPSLDSIMIAEANRRLIEKGHYGLNLSPQDKIDLKNFLLSLSDTAFVNNPDFKAP